MKFRKTKILVLVMLLTLLTLAACSNSTTLSSSEETIPSQSESTSSTPSNAPASVASSLSSSSAASSEPSRPASSQSEAPTQLDQPPVYSEHPLENCLAYLQQSLTDEQHGGIYRISDFNGSGLALHGGQDKADPYILIWAVDEAAIKRVIESYSGQKTEIVNVSAAYTLRQLNSVISELQNSEIATNINGMVMGENNRVLLDVIGKDNQEKVNSFLQSYDNKAAVTLFNRPGNDENPAT